MGRGGGTPLPATEILAGVGNLVPARRTVAGDIIFEEFDFAAALRTRYVKYGVKAPFMGAFSVAFAHEASLSISCTGRSTSRQPDTHLVCFFTILRKYLPAPALLCGRIDAIGHHFGIILELVGVVTVE